MARIMERRHEVGLMKAMGAGNASVAALFMTEAGVLALLGGAAGFAIGESSRPVTEAASSTPVSRCSRCSSLS